MNPELFLGKYTLVLGDINTGKTRFTSEFIKELIRKGYDDRIYIIDLAPNLRSVGGRISRYVYGFKNSIYRYSREIKAPRMEARDPEMLNDFIERNYKVAVEFFKDFISSDREILIVNDLTIFLHRASVDELISYIERSKTFFGNGYYGHSITDSFGTGLDCKERKKVKELASYMDIVIKL